MPQSPIKILLIEDSLTDAMLLQEHLSAVEFEKFEINHVQRLDEALALLRTEHFNVALIDLTLPDSTGPDTFARIQREAPLLPLVILTGLGDEMLAVEAVRRGVQDYLIKGQSDARQIVRAIRYAIERSRAEEAMRESESRFRLASDASRALVYDVDLVTRRAKSVYGLSRLLGYDPDEPNQNMEWWFRQVHPDDLYVTEKLIRGLAEGRSHVVQYRVRHKDGHYIAVEDSGSVVTNQHGQAVRVVGGIVDITLRKQAEQKLEEMRDELELMVLERTADLRRVNQTLKIITECNEAIARATNEKDLLDNICRIIVEVGGYRIAWVGVAENDTAASVRPVSCAGLLQSDLERMRFTPHDREPDNGPTGAALRTGQPCRERDYLTSPKLAAWRDVAVRYGFRSSVALALSIDSRLLGNLTIYAAEPDAFGERQLAVLQELADDVAFGLAALRTRADRDRAQQELERSTAQLRTLASELTHAEEKERRRLAQAIHDELQQLLVALKLAADTLKKQSPTPVMAATIQHMDELIKESINVARSLTFELSPPVLYDLGLARALEWLGRWMGSKHGLVVTVVASRDSEPDNEDVRVLLFQAVRELLFNIVKHAGVKTARVQMSTCGDNRVQIVVSDVGVGFNPEASSGDDSTQGGFGLFSIRGRLDLVGGSMRIESEMGQGSRVTLLAPLVSGAAGAPQAEAAATAHGARPPEPAETGPRTKIRVLLADDHILIRQGLCRLLQEHDDVDMVGEAGDGQAALELALRLKPDVVLMDINMPRLNGIAATRRLMEQLPQTKVIGLSVSDEPDLLEAMRDAGAVGFISKGSAIQTLIATIRSSLGGAKAGTALQ